MLPRETWTGPLPPPTLRETSPLPPSPRRLDACRVPAWPDRRRARRHGGLLRGLRRGAESSANCVVVAGKRGGEVRYAAVLVLASMRADINGAVRRHLDVRKISFAPHGPGGRADRHGVRWDHPDRAARRLAVLVDDAVVAAGDVVIGSGIGEQGPRALSRAARPPRAQELALAQ